MPADGQHGSPGLQGPQSAEAGGGAAVVSQHPQELPSAVGAPAKDTRRAGTGQVTGAHAQGVLVHVVLQGPGHRAWCWVPGPGHRGQSWGAAAIPSGKALCPAAWILAREAPFTQGGVHGAGALGNEMGFFASIHIGCRGASCGFCPGLRSVSLGGSEACCSGTHLLSSGWKPETAAGVACPRRTTTQILRAPPPAPRSFRTLSEKIQGDLLSVRH